MTLKNSYATKQIKKTANISSRRSYLGRKFLDGAGVDIFAAKLLTLRVVALLRSDLPAVRVVNPGSRPPDRDSRSSLTLQADLPLPFMFLVQGGGFEPPKLARQIYSLIPLATREPLRK